MKPSIEAVQNASPSVPPAISVLILVAYSGPGKCSVFTVTAGPCISLKMSRMRSK